MIREANKNDANTLDNLLSLLIQDERQYDDNISPVLMILDYYKNFISKKGHIFYVYEINSEIAGYIYAKIKNDGTQVKESAIIDALYVKEEYRHQQIASKLLDEIIKKIKSNNIDNIEISVMSNNIVAKNLYKKFGFITYKETMILK